MGSIAGGVPETARVPFSPCASYTHNIDGSHMTIFTLNSLLQSGSGPDQELDPFHGQVYIYIYISVHLHFCVKKGNFLYSAAFNPQDFTKRFTLYSLEDLFN